MEKINSYEQLKLLREKYITILKPRLESSDISEKHILVCAGTGCRASLSDDIILSLEKEIKANDLHDVKVFKTGCFGFCEKGPIVKVMPDNTFYTEVKPEDSSEIVISHIKHNEQVRRLLYLDPTTKERINNSKDMGFYKKQNRIALRNAGLIDPESIKEYIGNEGYAALGQVLTNNSPEDVIDIIKKSGLRGRGGGGFPTGLKWEIASKVKNDTKYVVCNADEGDPGAFMDRSLMEGDPHSIIEAMAICGYAIGASRGLVYIRAEYPLAVERIEKALKDARECQLLGENIFGSKFSFDIEIKYGAGAFVCGEETALIHSMEGERGEPTMKPPYPAESGYKGFPTNVNNVETLANISIIILKGADWFSSIGTETSKGTKVFALAGKVNNVGLIEVPMGITLREVIFEIGGGIKNGKKFKAVQTGGPSGGCLTEKHLDLKIDFDTLISAGSMMGSGGMIIMDQDDCMLSIAKFYLEFTVEESCGKCAPCRVGNMRLYEILEHISRGRANMEDLESLKNMALVIKDTALCGLGQTSPNPVLSTLENFYDEYLAHVVEKRCPAGRCKDLTSYLVNPELCIGCTACMRKCPVSAITGNKKEPHFINQDTCIRCGVCVQRCKFNAIYTK